MKIDPDITKRLPDVEAPSVVHVGSFTSPEAWERREARWRMRVLIVGFVIAVASVVSLAWMTQR